MINHSSVSTYTQPPESLGAISTLPYTPRIPASSDCQTFASTDLYAAAASVAPNPNQPNTTTAASTSAGAKASPSSQAGASRTGTGSGTAATSTQASGAQKHVARTPLGLFGAAVGVALFT